MLADKQSASKSSSLASTEVVSVSLLGRLYQGDISLKGVFGGYWLGLGLATALFWCFFWLLILIPVVYLGESMIESLLLEQDLSEDVLKGFEFIKQFKWFALLLFVPWSVLPSHLFYHTALIIWPVWKTLKRQERDKKTDDFWSTTGAKVLLMLPLATILLLGMLWGSFGVVVSLLGGPVSILSKILFFFFGLIPHGLLAGILFLIPSRMTVIKEPALVEEAGVLIAPVLEDKNPKNLEEEKLLENENENENLEEEPEKEA